MEQNKALELKNKGNQLFKERKVEEAVEMWSSALAQVDANENLNLFINLHNNLAAGYLDLKNYESSVNCCKDVLKIDQYNVKAFYRLIKSLYTSQKFLDCLKSISLMESKGIKIGSNLDVNSIKKNCRESVLKERFNVSNETVKITDIFEFKVTENICLVAYKAGPMQNNGYYLFNEGKEAILIDAVFNSEKFLQKELKRIDKLHVILTHGHIDHIFDLQYLKKTKKTKIYLHEGDKSWLNLGSDESLDVFAQFFPIPDIKQVINLPTIQKVIDQQFHLSIENIKCDEYFNKDVELELLGVKFNIINTPGHSEGSICLIFPKQNWIFTGDTLFCGSVGRSDLRGGKAETLVKSIKEKLYTLKDDLIVFPGHPSAAGNSSTIGKEKKSNQIVRETSTI